MYFGGFFLQFDSDAGTVTGQAPAPILENHTEPTEVNVSNAVGTCYSHTFTVT
jgi:hypothetical protein